MDRPGGATNFHPTKSGGEWLGLSRDFGPFYTSRTHFVDHLLIQYNCYAIRFPLLCGYTFGLHVSVRVLLEKRSPYVCVVRVYSHSKPSTMPSPPRYDTIVVGIDEPNCINSYNHGVSLFLRCSVVYPCSVPRRSNRLRGHVQSCHCHARSAVSKHSPNVEPHSAELCGFAVSAQWYHQCASRFHLTRQPSTD